ncbi:MAG: choice-of-anchor tandem repeat GloVer-containing protein [Candidatus Tumulicola sp.]
MKTDQLLIAFLARALAACSSGPGASLTPASNRAAVSQPESRQATGSFTPLYSFKSVPDGAFPLTPLIYVNGTFYGTTSQGGAVTANGNGTAFTITPSGSEHVLYSFLGAPDGQFPQSGLTPIGTLLYGTTPNGGSTSNGTVYSVDSSGVEKVLYSFKGGRDGALPTGTLVNVNGTLYGTTSAGGGTDCNSGSGCGTVFKVDASGAEKVIYRFKGGDDGATPAAGFILSNGRLYGTTYFGGDTTCSFRGCGTIFKVTTSGTETVEYRFAGGHDGTNPSADLLAMDGKFYGTTSSGGSAGHGTVFEWHRKGHDLVLHQFKGQADGSDPEAGLIAVGATLYGTTYAGGKRGFGTVFSILPSGEETVLYSFTNHDDGSNPSADLIAVGNVLYGTAKDGGTSGFGTVFSFLIQ